MEFKYNDGGRSLAGYKGTTGDCVTRAIAIALDKPYQEIYDEMFIRMKALSTGRSKIAKHAAKNSSPREGVFRKAYHSYLLEQGCVWIPCSGIGVKNVIHLKEEELPEGKIIVRLSKHIAAVVDKVLHDLHDCSREGTRLVYGYYKIGNNEK